MPLVQRCWRRAHQLQPDIGKTHGGLIAAFGLHLVKNGPIPKELGRLLKRAEEIRLVADYKGNSVEFDDAREMVEQAETFVDAMRAELMAIEPSARDGGAV